MFFIFIFLASFRTIQSDSNPLILDCSPSRPLSPCLDRPTPSHQLVIIGLQQRDRDDCVQLFAKLSARFRFVKVPVAAAHAHPLLGVFHIRQRRRQRQRLQCDPRMCAPLSGVPVADNMSNQSAAPSERSDEAETIRLPPQARRAFAMAK
jgi:hypothetical protein